MNRRIRALLAGAAVVGGLGAAVFPQHAASLVSLSAATVVVLLAVFVVVVAGAVSSDRPVESALDLPEPLEAPPLDPQGLRDARRDLAATAAPGQLPNPVWERVAVAAVLRLQRHGIDIDSPATRDQGRALLSQHVWRTITTRPDPGGRAPGARTSGGRTAAGRSASGRTQGIRSDPAATARAVHQILDELERLAPSGGRS